MNQNVLTFSLTHYIRFSTRNLHALVSEGRYLVFTFLHRIFNRNTMNIPKLSNILKKYQQFNTTLYIFNAKLVGKGATEYIEHGRTASEKF